MSYQRTRNQSSRTTRSVSTSRNITVTRSPTTPREYRTPTSVYQTPREYTSPLPTSARNRSSVSQTRVQSVKRTSASVRNSVSRNNIIPDTPKHRCQGKTQNGTRCTRNARVIFDGTQQRYIYGIPLPTIDCCFYCLQHTAVLFGVGLHKLTELWAFKDMSWEDYLAINPDYLSEALQKVS